MAEIREPGPPHSWDASPHLHPKDVLRELERLADFERRRGVRYWLDPVLAEALRELVRDVSVPQSARPAGRRGGPEATSARRSGARTPGDPAKPATSEPDPPVVGARDDPPAPGGEPAVRVSRTPQWPVPPLATGRDPDWEERLAAVSRRAHACIACGLAKTRTKVVFGVGSAHVPLVFVGEAPGGDEDAQGIPFVGRAGQLLTKIIAAIGLDRDEVYICNVLKCRPPGNRNPAPDEIACCTPFLQEQLAILKPRVICTLGLFASQYLLESTAPIGKLRGQIFDYHGTPLIPTYHPAALLRNPALKATVWEDVQLVRRTLDA